MSIYNEVKKMLGKKKLTREQKAKLESLKEIDRLHSYIVKHKIKVTEVL